MTPRTRSPTWLPPKDAGVPSIVPALVALCVSLVSARADAYRPFDGTDADVAGPRVFELELGPTHYYRQGRQNFLIAPALVLNLGIVEGTELVVDASRYVAFGPPAGDAARERLLDDDVLVKHVFRPGTLQGKSGVSVAAEGGVLTPEANGDARFGGSLDVITSYAWPWGTVHWNEWFEYTRAQHADLFTGVIVEGPKSWLVRPVAEVFYDRDFSSAATASALFGAIWQVRKSFALDVGLRGARAGSEGVAEARLGLTWGIGLGP